MNVNRMKKRILLLLLVIPALVKAQDVMTETRQELTSPDGAYRFTFYQRAVGEDNAQMYYTLTYKNRPVIEESKLSVLIENQLFESALGIPNDTCHFWCENLKLTETEHQKTDERWKPVYGERAEVRDCYNEMTLKLKKGEGNGNQDGGYDKRKNYFMNIIVRAYNEGVAFRYHFPEMTNGLFLHIVGEQTSFTMPEGTMAYYERWAQGPYELRPLEGWGKEESERPLTLKLPDGLSVALLEAEMVDYVRGKFRLSAEKPSTLETSLYSSVDIISPYSTPWRVIMVGERPVDLINNNDIVLNLNPACKLADTSWIKPGKVFRSGDLKHDRVKAAIDFAAERGIQYVHMDAGWYGPEMKMSSDATTVSPDKDLDIPALCKYAESKGIGLMVYVNQRALVQQLDTLLPLYKKWGLKGIKFGFVQIGNQIIIDAYNAYQSSLINYISVRVGDKELAKDLSQDVFLRLVSYKSMIRKDTVRSMIYTIAYNLIIDYLRRYYKKQDGISSYIYEESGKYVDDVENSFMVKELSEWETEAVNKLPLQRKIVYVMNRFQGLSKNEISVRLNVSVRTVDNHLYLGRKEVRDYVSKCI